MYGLSTFSKLNREAIRAERERFLPTSKPVRSTAAAGRPGRKAVATKA